MARTTLSLHRKAYLATLLLAVAVALIPFLASAQIDEDLLDEDRSVYVARTEPDNVILSLRTAVIFTTPRGDFPSLIVGNSAAGSGVIPASYGKTSTGYRIGLESLFPFNERLGLSLDLAAERWLVRYKGDSVLLPTEFETQNFQAALGLQTNIMVDERMFRYGEPGLRAIYLDGGLDFTFGPVADRVVSSSIIDTIEGERTEAVGSFEGIDPFRIGVGIRGRLGARFGLSDHIEAVVEAGYNWRLNPVFSSEVVRDSDFNVAHASAAVGLGYRF